MKKINDGRKKSNSINDSEMFDENSKIVSNENKEPENEDVKKGYFPIAWHQQTILTSFKTRYFAGEDVRPNEAFTEQSLGRLSESANCYRIPRGCYWSRFGISRLLFWIRVTRN